MNPQKMYTGKHFLWAWLTEAIVLLLIELVEFLEIIGFVFEMRREGGVGKERYDS